MDLPLAEGDVGDIELAVGRRVVHGRADQDVDALAQAYDHPLVARLAGQHHTVEQSGLALQHSERAGESPGPRPGP
jgi:hypothetical protein